MAIISIIGGSGGSGGGSDPNALIKPIATPMHYYEFESFINTDDFEDLSGNGYTIGTNGVSITTGGLGNAADFTASNSYLFANQNLIRNVVYGVFTFSLRVNFDTLAARATLLEFGNKTDDIEFRVYVNSNGSIGAVVGDGGSNSQTFTSATGIVTTGGYRHFFVTYDARTLTVEVFYNNTSVLIGVVNTVTPGPSDLGLSIGNSYSEDEALDGKIDQWIRYQFLLTAEERAAIYNGGAGIADPTAVVRDSRTDTVRLTQTDNYSNNLQSKLVVANANVSLPITQTGLNEVMGISVDPKTFSVFTRTLTGAVTLVNSDAVVQIMDSNGAARDVVLPQSPTTGRHFIIQANNTDGLNIKETGAGPTLVTLLTGTGNPYKADCIYDGTEWYITTYAEA